jgi:FAD/FMN-containing dehydrogenase
VTVPTFTSWGGLTARHATALDPADWPAARGGDSALPYGNGRSYGDSCLLDHGRMLLARRLSRIESLDIDTGLLVAEAGVTLAEVIAHCLPRGFFLPVTPGTRHVTLGGALANDVHGKNHHSRGTFGQHVAWFELLRSDGQRLICSSREHPALHAATIGGMGLTGLVTRLALRLTPVAGPWIRQDVRPFTGLEGFFDLAAESDGTFEHTVAWIDSLARETALGRGVFFRANHDPDPGPAITEGGVMPFLPFTPPVALINRLTLTGFNAAYRGAHARPRTAQRVSLWPFFYPLDRVSGWNRAYGRRGLRQFQCVIPMAQARETVADLIRATHKAGEVSFLTVLKLFGDHPSPGLLSFPRPGATLTLDMPYRGATTDALLAELDAITLSAGGRVNPYKDARMSAATFAASFPDWRSFAAHVDPALASNFWRRVSAG